MEKGVKVLMRMAKVVVENGTYKKLKSIQDEKELKESVKYALIASLEKEHYILKKMADRTFEKENSSELGESIELHIAKNKLLRVPAKIGYFKATFHEQEFKKVIDLLNIIKKELKNAKST